MMITTREPTIFEIFRTTILAAWIASTIGGLVLLVCGS